MKSKVLLVFISVIVSTIICLTCMYLFSDSALNKRIAWINVNKVYSEFQLKKELESKFTTTQAARKKITDSLELELRILSKQIQQEGEKAKDKISVFEAKRGFYLNKKNEFDTDNEQTQKNFNDQILKQITQYVKDYGKEKGYTIVFGAEGSGAIMYAKDAIEITDEAIVYLNQKYTGAK